jgi:ribosomal protein L11 methyltransferase
MPQYKATILTADLDGARSVAGFLEEALVPPPLAVTLFEHGASGHKVDAYFETPPDLGALVEALAALGKEGIGAPELTLVPDENWVTISQAALPPITAGRFVVHGSHDRHKVALSSGAIEIDAGEAFGTAHHATTLGCLLAIDRLTRRGRFDHVLDLGCGSGVLAIAAARALPHARIIGSDIDAIATGVATANAKANRAANRIRFVTATGLEHPLLRREQSFDLIIANILARPLIDLAPRLRRAVVADGRLVLSGLLSTQATEVGAHYRAAGFRLERRDDLVGWTILTLAPL